MSKKGTYNSGFFGNFAARLHGTPIRFGILIGTPVRDGLRDAVFAAPTPPPPGDDSEGKPRASAGDVAALLKSAAGSMRFTDWAAEHVAQIRRLLPAGLEPCGCFVVAAEAAAKGLAALLVPVLRGMPEALVLSIDPSSRKLSFWQHTGGAKPALLPAQVKADAHKDALLMWTFAQIDVVAPVGPAGESEDRDGDDRGLNALASRLDIAFEEYLGKCSFAWSNDGAPRRMVDNSSEQLVNGVVPKGAGELQCELLRGGTILDLSSGADEGACVRQRCSVVATALVLRRDVEMRSAIELLRRGVVASAKERLQMALDEAAEAADGGAARPDVLQLPWRALGRPKDVELPMWCGDYCLPDEPAGAALERLGELLGLTGDDFEVAPSYLDERGLCDHHYGGQYAPPSAATQQRSSGKAGGGALPLAACAAAVAALLAAAAVPALLRPGA